MNDEKKKALAAYLFFPAVYFLAEKEKNETVRFHSVQAITLCIAGILGNMILRVIPVLGWMLMPFWGLLVFVVWLIAVVKTYQGEKYKVPFLTDWVMKKIVK